jgi:bifunctional UDP-N-acetylglucosamine pyrophosphorylase/glucosamine-1-phosphate N-acetyltransferase
MRSKIPKPLHRLCGLPMLIHALRSLASVEVDRVVVVVGYHGAEISKVVSEEAPSGLEIHFVEQPLPRGTGDAVAVALTAFPDDDVFDHDDVIVLPGDAPLIRPATLASLVEEHHAHDAAATLLTAVLDDPTGYGRVVRSTRGEVTAIVEQSDATSEQLSISEVGTSIYCFDRSVLAPSLRRLRPYNAKGEYYLTDVIEVLHQAGYLVRSMIATEASETAGVNDRAQLAVAEAILRARINLDWMRAGVRMLDPATTYVDVGVELAEDVLLGASVALEGSTKVSRGAVIGSFSRLVDTTVGEGAHVESSTAISATIGPGEHVGPYVSIGEGSSTQAGSDPPATSFDGRGSRGEVGSQ